MSDVLLITGALEPSAEVLPALGLLLHRVRVLPADAPTMVEAPQSISTAASADSTRKQVLNRPPEPKASPDPTTVRRILIAMPSSFRQ